MAVISAREIFQTSRQDIWNIPDEMFSVTYEDGVIVENTKRQIIFNRYCWELFSVFPLTPIASTCDVKAIMKGGFFNAETHIRLLEAITKHIISLNHLDSYIQKQDILRKTYEIVDMIQNEIIENISPYVFTINALDFINVYKDPAMAAMRENAKPTPEGVDSCYRQIRTFIQNFKGTNNFVSAYRAKSINDNQANQCIGPRGFVTDLDRTVFKQPIMTGFIEGMGNLYEMIAESCSAAKALMANDLSIKESEYTSRRIQILTMVVQRVHNGDCGSQEYHDILVDSIVLENLKGIYYLKDDKTLGCIEGNEDHLKGKIIKVRTALGCKHHNRHEICSTCLGKVSQNFPENSNLGYTMTAFLMEKVTQSILGSKHLMQSVKKSSIKLEGIANKYFYSTDEGDLYFHQDVDLKGLQMILANAKVSKLVDVLNLPHTNIGLSKIGELDEIVIKNTNHKVPMMDKLYIAYKDRSCVITKPLLEFIKSSHLESDARGNFVIPLDTFDKSKPVFNNPLKETDVLGFVKKISAIIETTKDKVVDPYEKLNLLTSAVWEKFRCNFSVLQVLIYATTTYNAAGRNYKLGRNSHQPYCETESTLFHRRDFAAFAVFEKQMGKIISSPSVTFSNEHREEHPMSVLFNPQDIVKR